MEARARELAPSAALFPVEWWLVEQMPDYKDRKETPRKADMACSYYSRYSELTPDSSQKIYPAPIRPSLGGNLEQQHCANTGAECCYF